MCVCVRQNANVLLHMYLLVVPTLHSLGPVHPLLVHPLLVHLEVEVKRVSLQLVVVV